MTSEVITLMNASAATGAGSAHELKYPSRSFAIEASWVASGAGHDKAITVLVLAVEGSLTGTTFEAIDTALTASGGEITAGYMLRFVVDKPVKYIRINPTTVTITGTTGAMTLTVKVLPVR